MAGVVVVRTEAPPLRRAGTLDVLVDGELVGTIKQGRSDRFEVAPGPHTVRVGAGISRSNTLTVEVAEGGAHWVSAYGTGFALLAAVLPLLYVVCVIPGLVFRLRPEDDVTVPAEPLPPTAAGGDATSTGLWWESDPKLAKRFRKSGTS